MSWNGYRWWNAPVLLAALALISVPALAQEDGEEDRLLDALEAELDEGPEYGETTLGYGPSVPKFGEDIYRVVRGDTLWGICSRFFGDPERWPALWSINNEEVTNPHYIYPGQILRFRPGTDIYPPQLLVGRPGEGSYEYEEEFQDVVRFIAGQRECGIRQPFSPRDQRTRMTAPGFVIDDSRREDNMKLGVLENAPVEGELIGQNQYVYLHFNDDDAEDVNCGDIYTIYRPEHAVSHPHVRKANVGNMYAIVGEVLITDVNLRTDIATGKVIESWFDLERGDFVTDRIPVSSMVTAREAQGQIEGYIIDKLLDENTTMQRFEVVFIDRGRNSGVENGTVFWVMRRGDPLVEFDTGKARTESRLPLYVIGKLVVFSAEESHSTAVLVESANEIEIGDQVLTVIEEVELN